MSDVVITSSVEKASVVTLSKLGNVGSGRSSGLISGQGQLLGLPKTQKSFSADLISVRDRNIVKVKEWVDDLSGLGK